MAPPGADTPQLGIEMPSARTCAFRKRARRRALAPRLPPHRPRRSFVLSWRERTFRRNGARREHLSSKTKNDARRGHFRGHSKPRARSDERHHPVVGAPEHAASRRRRRRVLDLHLRHGTSATSRHTSVSFSRTRLPNPAASIPTHPDPVLSSPQHSCKTAPDENGVMRRKCERITRKFRTCPGRFARRFSHCVFPRSSFGFAHDRAPS